MVPGTLRVWLATAPVNMSKSIDALAAHVVEHLAQDPRHDGVFVFVNTKRDRAKLLWRDNSGWCLLYKRLDERMVCLPTFAAQAKSASIDARALALLLEGAARVRKSTRARKVARESRDHALSIMRA